MAISVKVENDLLDGLDRFIADRDDPPRGRMSRDDAVDVVLRDWLMGQGYLALPDDPYSITPALDAARVPKG